jgi:hypothetical protein
MLLLLILEYERTVVKYHEPARIDRLRLRELLKLRACSFEFENQSLVGCFDPPLNNHVFETNISRARSAYV